MSNKNSFDDILTDMCNTTDIKWMRYHNPEILALNPKIQC